MDGVQGLRAAMDFPPLGGSELVDTISKVAVRHHWQSGFIGGSVGVMGTLTAIQVRYGVVQPSRCGIVLHRSMTIEDTRWMT